jgi:hypothetical protein
MKLMLRPEWKPRPVSSFLGYLDLKIGVTVAALFAVSLFVYLIVIGVLTYSGFKQLLNKVAGVYGLIAALTGAGGSFAQLTLYVYSVFGLVALAWGLRAVAEVGYMRLHPWARPDGILMRHRKTRSVRYTSRTCSSPITSSQRCGQYSSR